jgi:3-isopropylmalate dehydrogenase
MKHSILVLAGDGIGPEVVAEGVRCLQAIAHRFGHQFEFTNALIGGAAIDAEGSPLSDATLALAKQSDAILLGAVGGPKWSDPSAKVRPEQGLLAIRKALGLFANLRPVKPSMATLHLAPLKPEYLAGVDMLVVRELTGGIYFGDKTRTADSASDLCTYTVAEIERIVRMAADFARKRRGKLTQVDKANVLETSRLWREVTNRIMAQEYPDVQLEHVLVDSAAMHLLSKPASFDVIVTENMFGDILTDEASMLAGSLGLLPSASLALASGERQLGLFEPIHGSAPDIAGLGKANPIATIASCALLLRYSLKMEAEAQVIEAAIEQVLANAELTPDLGGKASTQALGQAVAAAIASV